MRNDFTITSGKKIEIKGSQFDATNLTKLLDNNSNKNILSNISKKLTIKFDKVATELPKTLSNFTLIGDLENGKFVKITSKGAFSADTYLDISLKKNKKTGKKILEIYSDVSEPLLYNYKFFKGLKGGKLLIVSVFDDFSSNTKLSIEDFKVKNAPGFVKLLSLADFGGMADAINGDGLTFEKLEMNLDKNQEVLNLRELYAIGPSISILMEGYIENKSGLVSLRGTMVPAKTLNKVLSKIPVVGKIIIPKEIGEGLFGVSFKIKGMPKDLKTTVNPIKSLTPRFIQKALKRPK